MGRVLKWMAWALLALVIVGGYVGYRVIWGTPFTLRLLADRQAIFLAMSDPELFTQIGAVDGTFLDRHSGQLTPVGVAKRDADYARAERYLDELRRFDRAKLSPTDQVTYDILEDQYTSGLAFRQFPWFSSEGLYPIAPMFGTNASAIAFLQTTHTIRNAKTAENYVRRLEALGPKLDAVTAEMRRQSQSGVVLPASLAARSMAIAKDTIAPAPEANPLVQKIVDAASKLSDLGPTERDALKARAVAAIRGGIYPAYQRMIAALDERAPSAATQGAGLGRLKDGAALYAIYLKQRTTSDYTPEEVHAIGVAEVARISKEMDAILTAQGLAGASLADRMKGLNDRPDQRFPNTDDGRAQILARYLDILREVEARMPEYFSRVPPGPLRIERVPVALEQGAAGGSYRPAALDGSRLGTFFANLRDVAETPRYTMKSLLYHEGVPGHHFQIDTALHLEGMPLIRQQPIYTAFVEGWALYAERLAAEIGMYKDDPLGDLGRLQAEIFRAVRLVVDTGIHAKGWSREQAIAYMVANTGMAESDVTTEIERYMSLPGQACAYKIGQLKILELRETAERELGDRFQLKDFHAVVLENGAVPLRVLEGLVRDWIARVQA